MPGKSFRFLIYTKKNNIHNREHASFNKRVFIWMTEGDQAM